MEGLARATAVSNAINIGRIHPVSRQGPRTVRVRTLFATGTRSLGPAIALVVSAAEGCDFLLKHVVDQATHGLVKLPAQRMPDQLPRGGRLTATRKRIGSNAEACTTSTFGYAFS